MFTCTGGAAKAAGARVVLATKATDVSALLAAKVVIVRALLATKVVDTRVLLATVGCRHVPLHHGCVGVIVVEAACRGIPRDLPLGVQRRQLIVQAIHFVGIVQAIHFVGTRHLWFLLFDHEEKKNSPL